MYPTECGEGYLETPQALQGHVQGAAEHHADHATMRDQQHMLAAIALQ